MTTTAWAHLPNAAHVDRILASLAAHPEKWEAAQTAARAAARAVAWDAAWIAAQTAAQTAARAVAWDAARDAAWIAARGAARGAAWIAARGAAWTAITALVAWDDCAYMLELPEDALKLLRAVGNEQAMLLSVAAKVLKETS